MHCYTIETKKGKEKWVCVEEGPKDPVTGKRKQIARRADTKKEAKKRVNDALRTLEDDGINENAGKKITFDAVGADWLEVYSKTGVKNSTIRIRKKEINILNRFMAKAPINQISHAAYQKIINQLGPDYARTTVQGVNTTANMIFKHAIKNKLIRDNPGRDVIVPKKRRTVEEIEKEEIEEKYLERSELEEFLQEVNKYGLELDKERFYLLAFSGMRSGELCALKWSDITFSKNQVRITKTLYNENNNMKSYELTPPKTEGSIRTIELEDEVIKLLQEHKKRQQKLKMKYRHTLEEYHDENFVFCRPNGYPFAPKNIVVRMERLLEKTSIEKHATPHIFRHTHISMMAEAGIDLATVMKRVGHEDTKTTMKIYTHVTNKMKEDASDKVRNLYGNVLENINTN
ncbi:tyrosine-type recombinase/integrase [Pontibacillus salicampi]|uniref:Tyrosine-type recombinase/integrase n=1 Tax=Pontibacillus salicampi TaxID=1449801 RepID=A0ABV6LTS5_9BACI